jgi:hypothetical protein
MKAIGWDKASWSKDVDTVSFEASTQEEGICTVELTVYECEELYRWITDNMLRFG